MTKNKKNLKQLKNKKIYNMPNIKDNNGNILTEKHKIVKK